MSPRCPACHYDLATPYLEDGEEFFQCWQCLTRFRSAGVVQPDSRHQLTLDLPLSKESGNDLGR
jgi:hypothetical protein